LTLKTYKTNWHQTDREHRYKYTGDNGEEGQHQVGGGDKQKDNTRWGVETSRRTGETDQGVTHILGSNGVQQLN
jgi:hypothetical protein